jgi:glycosyltransferase involved in cell wall biosynthesis
MKELAAELGIADRVRFLGRISDVASFLAAGDVAVVPSREECFGLSLVEAMASGKAVVAARVGGMREIITPGLDGLTFESEDHRALADRIEELAANRALRNRLARQARQTVCERYSTPRVLAMLDEAFGFEAPSEPNPPRRAASAEGSSP